MMRLVVIFCFVRQRDIGMNNFFCEILRGLSEFRQIDIIKSTCDRVNFKVKRL